MNAASAAVKRVGFDDVARFSSWPAILIGARSVAPRRRTAAEVLREYDVEKWGPALRELRAAPPPHLAQVLQWQGIDASRPMLFAEGREFLTAPAMHVFSKYQERLIEVLQRYRASSLVELGSGLGDKLLTFARALGAVTVRGGEFTPSGIACGRALARKWGMAARFCRFDFNDPRTLGFVPEGSLVFTAHAIEQVPMLRQDFVHGLCRRRPRWVAHFEPCYEDHSIRSVPGLMRRRYIEINDYNRNLVGLLRNFEAQGRLRIVEHRRDLFGVSPFNPTSVLVWTPVAT